MFDEVYSEKILEFAANISRLGHLEAPDAMASKRSRLCGSVVTVELCAKFQGGNCVVSEFAHDVKACALGQAASSIMASNVIGATASELKLLQKTMIKMLKENGAAPKGRFSDLKYFEAVRDHTARHESIMLTFNAVTDCLEQIEAGEKARNRKTG